ncbi:MAG: MATE family efflux transporter [Clostridiales bacterium]|nr:MATE family efflux transporter [Clostridiales bacterium]
MEKNNDYLGTAPLGRLLAKLAIPTVAAQLINMLYNIVDRIYIGHMPGDGDLALTGIGICMPLILAISAFAALAGAGGAPRTSMFMGGKNQKGAEAILGNSLTVLLCVSAVLTAVLLIWSRDLLLAFGASENTIGYATDYMNIYAVGTVFVQLTLGMNAYITAQGFAKESMLTVAIGAVCNILLDPLFIFVFDMGVKGAALATILSQGISAVWVMTFLLGKKTILRFRKEHLRPRWEVIGPCLALGLAPFIMQSTESLISVCFNSSLLKYGGDVAVGAMTILTSVMQLAMLPLNGLGQGAIPIISYNFGARNKDRVRNAFKLLVKANTLYSCVFGLLIILFPGVFAAIFTDKPELQEFASRMLPIYCAMVPIFGIQTACQMTFMAIGSAKSSIMVAVMRKIVLLIPLIYLLPAILPNQTLAVYLAEPVADFFSVCFAASLFAVQFRKALKTLE